MQFLFGLLILRQLLLPSGPTTAAGVGRGYPDNVQVSAPIVERGQRFQMRYQNPPDSGMALAPVTAFINVAVIPMDRERVLAGQTVVVVGSRITVIGTAARVRVPAGAVRVDGRGKFLIPGLADMHVHLGKTLYLDKYDSLKQRASPFAYSRVDVSLLVQLLSGVTTVRQMSSPGDDSFVRLARATRTGELLGPQIYAGSQYSPAAADIARYKAAGYDFIKFHGYADVQEFDASVAEAHRVGIPIAGHVQRVSLEQALRAGFASIEHLSGYLESLTGLQVEPHAMTKHAGVWICPTLRTVRRMGEVFDSIFAMQGFHNMGAVDHYQYVLKRQLIKPLHDGGVRLLLGTDDVWDLGPFAISQELEELVADGLTSYQALETGTRNVAVFFGALDSTGTVAVGKRADLVLLTGNPLADIRYTADPAGVMLGGRWLLREEIYHRIIALVGQGPKPYEP